MDERANEPVFELIMKSPSEGRLRLIHGAAPSSDGAGERRGATRVPLWRPVRFRGRSCSATFSGELCDLSRRGAFIATSKAPPLGTVIAAAFYPDAAAREQPIGFKARVVRVGGDHRRPGVGVEFIAVNDQHREGIRQMLARMLRINSLRVARVATDQSPRVASLERRAGVG